MQVLHNVQNIVCFFFFLFLLDLVWWAYSEYWIAGANCCENAPEK